MGHDNFLVYLLVLIIGAFVAITWVAVIFEFTSFQAVVSYAVILTIISGGGIILIERSCDKPIKMFSIIPVKLNGKWCFVYYLTAGSHMVSPQQLFLNEITK